MSLMMMVSAMKSKVGNPLRKLVLIKLADNSNDKGECWPSYAHISDQCEIARSTVIKHIKRLEQDGFLKIENRAGPKGNSSNIYHLTISMGSPSNITGSTTGITGSPSGDIPPSPSGDSGISNSFEPSIESVSEPSMSGEKIPDAEIVINYFNETCKTKYKKTTKSHIENINGRLSDGHSVEDLKKVIDFKYAEWKDQPSMAQYIRPQTLFNAGKFQGYLTASKTKPDNKASAINNISKVVYEPAGKF